MAGSGRGAFRLGAAKRLMLGAVQDRVAQPGIVLLAEGRQDYRLGKLWADEALAFQRGPNGSVPEARRIACRDHCLPEVEMVAMRIG